MENMSDRDWENYSALFSAMASFLIKPDLVVYLRASTDTLLNRIKARGRDYEQTINPEYLHKLNMSYDKCINSVEDYPDLIIESDRFNIFHDSQQLKNIENQILKKI